MDAYIEIDGKRAKLTEEQLKALGLEPEKKNPFDREKGKSYFFISGSGKVVRKLDYTQSVDSEHYTAGNYCKSEELMEQRALHEILNRLLWRYSMEHTGDKDSHSKYGIFYRCDSKEWAVDHEGPTRTIGIPYFNTREIAENAIKEIVIPFMAEHPEFEW